MCNVVYCVCVPEHLILHLRMLLILFLYRILYWWIIPTDHISSSCASMQALLNQFPHSVPWQNMRHSHNRYRAPTHGLRPTYRPTIFGAARIGNVPGHFVFLVLTVMCAFFLCLFLWTAVCISAQLITPSPSETPVSGWCVDHGMCSV